MKAVLSLSLKKLLKLYFHMRIWLHQALLAPSQQGAQRVEASANLSKTWHANWMNNSVQCSDLVQLVH